MLGAGEGEEQSIDDGFSSFVQWLHWRINFTRGEPRPREKLYLPTIIGIEGAWAAKFEYPEWAFSSANQTGKKEAEDKEKRRMAKHQALDSIRSGG